MKRQKLEVSVAADQFDRLARPTQAVAAVEELIWNGLDAEADSVAVTIGLAGLGAVESVCVVDDGHGMSFTEAELAFSELGASWKRNSSLTKSGLRGLHGKNGEGRFRAFALGGRATWVSCVEHKDGTIEKTEIVGNLGDGSFVVSELQADDSDVAGTTVATEFPRDHVGQLLYDDTTTKLITKLASYLARYDVDISYDGRQLSVDEIKKAESSLTMSKFASDGVDPPQLVIVEWTVKVEPSIVLCDEDGVALHEVTDRVPKAKAHPYTAYLRWGEFKTHETELSLGDVDHPVLSPIFEEARSELGRHLDRLKQGARAEIIDRWKEDQIYPFQEPAVGGVQEAERQIFDAVAVTASRAFGSDKRSTKLSLRLIKEALEADPGSLHEVLTEVLDLSNEEIEDFAELLKRTPLAAVISTTKLVADRLRFLDDLDNLTLGPSNRKRLLERTQLHRILAADRAWVFGEEFSIAVSDSGLSEVLKAHRKLIGEDTLIDDDEPVTDTEGHTRIVDLMLSASGHGPQRRRNLVVELKRPDVVLGYDEQKQINRYAAAISADERFNSPDIEWDFWLVGNRVHKDLEDVVNQQGKPRGLASEPSERNYRIWWKTWGELIEENRQRHHFYRDKLRFVPSEQTASLESTLARLLPDATDAA